VCKKLINPFESKGRWFRANLHTHTDVSDGVETAETRVKQYRGAGYDILAITDHEKTSELTKYSTEDFLVLCGIEAARPTPCGKKLYNLVYLNIPHYFDIPQGIDINTEIELVKNAGGETVLALPYWSGLNINDMLAVKGYIAIEVYNAVCEWNAKGYSGVHWDNLLDEGRIVGGIACDDTHADGPVGGGWTYIKAQELTATCVMQALRMGCFYSSSGPSIEYFGIKDGKIILQCSPVVEVRFIGHGRFGQQICAEPGEKITTAEFEIDEQGKYVRAEIIDERGGRAWTNPVVFL